MTSTTAQTTQVYRLFIRATPEEIWDAITKPEFTERYFYGSRITSTQDRHRMLGPDDAVWGDSEVRRCSRRASRSSTTRGSRPLEPGTHAGTPSAARADAAPALDGRRS
jgi:hypothetical protein